MQTTIILTVSGQHGPVLSREAGACDAAVGVEGDPHRAAVCVDRWRCHVTTEPATTERETPEA